MNQKNTSLEPARNGIELISLSGQKFVFRKINQFFFSSLSLKSEIMQHEESPQRVITEYDGLNSIDVKNWLGKCLSEMKYQICQAIAPAELFQCRESPSSVSERSYIDLEMVCFRIFVDTICVAYESSILC
jgi:hypothetical protein